MITSYNYLVKNENMQVIILAGGKGTRMGNITEKVPKPMIRLGSKPMILRIMEYYSSFGFQEFILLAGYKQEIIKDYFANLNLNNFDVEIDFKNKSLNFYGSKYDSWNVKIINTGLETNTGARILKAKKFITSNLFHITYGDGLSNVNLSELVKHHNSQNKIFTITAVKPPTKFGELSIDNSLITSFEEKPKLSKGFINGGFMVTDKRIFDFIKGDVMLEREPLREICRLENLNAYNHEGYWQCFDTAKDVGTFNESEYLRKIGQKI